MKFCPNCGTQVDDDCKFCSECGTSVPMKEAPKAAPAQPAQPAQPVYTEQPAQPAQPVYTEQPAQPAQPVYTAPKKSGGKGAIIAIVAVLVVAIAAAVVLFATGVIDFGNGSSKNSKGDAVSDDVADIAADYLEARYESLDAEALVKCIPTEAWDAILEAKDMSEDEALEYLQTWLDQATNGVTYEFGEITGTAWDDDEVQELNETLSQYLDGDITSAMTCTLGISAEIDGEEVQLEVDETFIEYDGEWYFDPLTFAGYLDGSGEDGGNVGGTPGTYPGYNENGNENGGSNSSSDIAYNSFSSGEAAVDAYLQASVYDFDARAAVSTMPEELVTKACENQNMTLDQLIAQLQVSLDNSKNLLSAYEYSTTITAVTELTSTQMANYLKPYAGIFSGEITAINQYTVTVSVPGETSQNMILTAACYEGRWYIFGM